MLNRHCARGTCQPLAICICFFSKFSLASSPGFANELRIMQLLFQYSVLTVRGWLLQKHTWQSSQSYFPNKIVTVVRFDLDITINKTRTQLVLFSLPSFFLFRKKQEKFSFFSFFSKKKKNKALTLYLQEPNFIPVFLDVNLKKKKKKLIV